MTNLLFPELELNKVFGDVLKKYREERKISQEALALDAGISRTYVSRLESGIRQPTITTLFGLAYALKVSPAELITATEKEFSENNK